MRSLVVLAIWIGCDDGKDGDSAALDSGVVVVADADGDGYTEDCNDNDPSVHPGAAEICDGIDNDCNELVDDDATDALTWYLDADGDGFGDADESEDECEAPVGYVPNAEDCDDADARFNPSAIESDCEDPSDYNCDGSVGYADVDGDGFAACTECDDSDSAVNPDAIEVCNGIDDDCNDLVDDDDSNLEGFATWYADADGDGFGGSQFVVESCDAPAGYVDNTEDCDDLDAATYPSAAEICDETDNDCDGEVDEGVGTTWYVDTDGDGYGDATAFSEACNQPAGFTWNGNDCDDSNPAVHPGGLETCDGVDNNCDGTVDGASALDASDFYADADSDGYGDGSSVTAACSVPTAHVSNADDCNDADITVNPAATEVCDGVDNNCDGTTDGADASDAGAWFTDADGDGYGGASSTLACAQPSGTSSTSDDCNDFSSGVNPGATESCNLVDDDCDGVVDEADSSDASSWYADSDGDGYGDLSSQQAACSQPANHVADSSDCDDNAFDVNPSATEVFYDGVDGDCDGTSDYDQDGDGDDAVAHGGTDRDDTDSSCTTSCRDGLSQATAGITCGTLLADFPSALDGTYYLDFDNDGDTSNAAQYYCDMTAGGWTYASQGTPFSVAYTGSSETLTTVNASAEYEFTAYGAQGGDGENNIGGKGGQSVGSKTFSAATVLTVNVGGKGSDGGAADNGSCNTRTGGFNGGGRGTQGGSGGGGATDVRTSTGSLTGDASDPRILVAAGGGGCGGQNCYGRGGNGGGLTGENGQTAIPGQTDGNGGSGGSQSAPGVSEYNGAANGAVGLGGDNSQCNDEGGGGAGWYGGGAGGLANTTGGGGSSYYDGMDADQSTAEGVRSGDGLLEYILR